MTAGWNRSLLGFGSVAQKVADYLDTVSCSVKVDGHMDLGGAVGYQDSGLKIDERGQN